MAEKLLQKSLSERGVNDVAVESAGVMGLTGHPAAKEAVAELEKHGVDLSGHIAQTLTSHMIDEADLVVVMERAHLYSTITLRPDAGNKIILMGSLLPWLNTDEIEDPYGGSDRDFAKACGVIRDAAEILADKIANGAEITSHRG